MHLIDPLVSGIRGAELGSVRLYRRGTSTPATWYEDFEASSADSTGDAIELDSNGGATVFVNELVDVRVFDADGTTVREFVAGHQAYAVEVISSAFTGVDYTTGASAVSEPTTAGALFDRWLTSAGAIDWKGLYTGASARLQDIFGALYGLFYNVKSPEFGAAGDGTTNDLAAFQAAHDAAYAAGGGVVVVPPGTYNISADISWKTGVSLVCVPGTVTLRVTTADSHITLGLGIGATGSPTVFYGCRFDSTVPNTSTQVVASYASDDDISFWDCQFLASSFATGAAFVVSAAPGAKIRFSSCLFTGQADVSLIQDTRPFAAGALLELRDCDIRTVSTVAYTSIAVSVSGSETTLSDVRFTFDLSSTNACVYLASASSDLRATRCRFAGAYAVKLFQGGKVWIGDDNDLPGGSGRPYLQSAAADVLAAYGGRLSLLPFESSSTTDTTATATDWVENWFLRSTNAAPPAITIPKVGFYGQVWRAMINNDSGGNWGTPPTFVTTAQAGISAATAPNLLNGHTAAATFVAILQTGSTPGVRWKQVGDWVDTTT